MASSSEGDSTGTNGTAGSGVSRPPVAAVQSMVTQVSQSSGASSSFLGVGGSQAIPRPLFFKMEKYRRRLDRFHSTNPPHSSHSAIMSSSSSSPFSGNVAPSSISGFGKAHSIGHIPSSSTPPSSPVASAAVHHSNENQKVTEQVQQGAKVAVPFLQRLKRLLCCFGNVTGSVNTAKSKQTKGDSDYVPAKILMTTTANVNNSTDTKVDDRSVNNTNTATSNNNNNNGALRDSQPKSILKAGPDSPSLLPRNTEIKVTAVHSSINELNQSAYNTAFETRFLLKNLAKEDVGKKCLVLDLDETLIHSSFKAVPDPDFIIPVEIEGVVHNVFVLKRPHVDEFLKRLGTQFEVVIFTASLAKYADPVIDQLDTHKVVKHRLFRESCYNHRGAYVKDLSQLGRDLNNVIILDNAPGSYLFHPNNAIPVTSWFNDLEDNELLELIDLLEGIKKVPDVRAVLQDGNSILEEANSSYSIS